MNFFTKVRLVFAVSLGLVLTACGAKDPLTEQIVAGQAHFKGYGCVTCHQVGGTGGAIGPDLTYIGFRKSPEWLDLWLKDPSNWKHNTLMPNFFFKDATRKALVAYLATLKGETYQNGKAPWDLAELKDNPIKRGESIFIHAGCVGCHGGAGKGGYPNNNVAGGLIPSLLKVSEGYSKDELKEKIQRGVPQSISADATLPPPMIHMPAWSQVLKDDEIDALVEYLYSLNPKGPEEVW